MEYDCLSLGLKDYIEENGHRAISARALMSTSVPTIRQIFGGASMVPLEEERARLLREVSKWHMNALPQPNCVSCAVSPYNQSSAYRCH